MAVVAVGQHGVNASFVSSGTQTSNNSGTPGTNGQGGSGGGETWGSGGGGGFTSNGGNGGSPATGGFSFTNGGVGGSTKSMYAAIGGFGGGGGVAYSGGGGGGYSGGAGGISSEPYGGGGGGGSFNSGSTQESSSGHNIDHGKVVITFINTAYEFTNAGAIGREGPTQSEINTAYQGTNLENNVTVQTRGIQEWSVPFSGTYRIEVFGASGGDSTLGTAGKGASMSGNFTFNESQLLKIIPGQKGKSNSNHGGGGGGGSFVVNAIDSSLLIAAGGGVQVDTWRQRPILIYRTEKMLSQKPVVLMLKHRDQVLDLLHWVKVDLPAVGGQVEYPIIRRRWSWLSYRWNSWTEYSRLPCICRS